MRALLLLSLAACRGDGLPPPGPAPASPAPRRGGAVTVAQAEDLDSIDPLRAVSGFAVFMAPYLYDVLLDYQPATAADPTALRPQLAERWTVSDDGLRYTFHLRAATFSDGQPVVADDFVHAFERARTPQGGPMAFFLDPVEAATAPDERTLELRLRRPEPALPSILAMRALTPQKRGAAPTLGTGPFVVEYFRPGERIVLRRNPRYWDPERPYLDEIRMELQVPYDVAVLRFLEGTSDLLMQPAADAWFRFAASREWAPYVQRVDVVQTDAIAINTRHAPFNDVRVRQALNYAIDKDDMVRLMNGRAIVSHGMLPPAVPGHDAARAPYPHDPARARALLAEAGVAEGLEVTYATTTGDYEDRRALSIQADLSQVGIRVRLRRVHPRVLETLMQRGEYDLAPTSWHMDFLDPWDFLEVRFHSRNVEMGLNDAFYRNPTLDELLDRAHGLPPGPERDGLYRRADRLLFEDCPYVWLVHRVWVDVRRPRLMGYRPHPVWGPSLVESWVGGE